MLPPLAITPAPRPSASLRPPHPTPPPSPEPPSLLGMVQVVEPATILRWHRAGFRSYWRWKSRKRAGRPRIDRELRNLIRRMSRENPLWGAPRIHGELLKLGFELARRALPKEVSSSISTAIFQMPALCPFIHHIQAASRLTFVQSGLVRFLNC